MNKVHLSVSLILLFCAIIIAISNRAISNHILRKNYIDTKQGDPASIIPSWIIIYNLIGFTLLISSIIFAFTIKIWLGLLFFLTWGLMYFYKPELERLQKIYQKGSAKRCVICKKFYDYDSFAKVKLNIDGLDNKCKACYYPDILSKKET